MTCPICAKETDAKYRPFCSRRCADVDLGRWLSESYVVADQSAEGAQEAAEAVDDSARKETPRRH